MLTLEAILATTKHTASYGEGVRPPTPRDSGPLRPVPEDDVPKEKEATPVKSGAQ